MTKPRVLLADDHRIVAAGLEALLAPDYELAGRAEDGRSLIELVRATPADFVVADISMPGLNGIDALQQMRREGIEVPVVFLTMHTEPAYARRALEAGAAGYVLKHAAPRELLQALDIAGRGGIYVSKEIARALDISHRTVEYHKYQAMESLGVGTNAELVKLALRLNLLSP